jgi:hypothetical protein
MKERGAHQWARIYSRCSSYITFVRTSASAVNDVSLEAWETGDLKSVCYMNA